MKKNIVPAILFVFMLLLAPVAPAQEGPVPAAGTGTVEDLSPPPAPVAPAAAASGPQNAHSLASGLLPSSGLGMLGALGAIILAMTLLYLVIKLLNRPRRFKSLKERKSAFELRGIQPLDDTKYLAAVQIEGRLIVVGVTADRVIPVANWLAEEEENQPRLKFSPAYPGSDLGPSLDDKPMEDDNSPPDISIAEQGRYREK